MTVSGPFPDPDTPSTVPSTVTVPLTATVPDHVVDEDVNSIGLARSGLANVHFVTTRFAPAISGDAVQVAVCAHRTGLGKHSTLIRSIGSQLRSYAT